MVRRGWEFRLTIIEKILSYERNKYSIITILGWHIVIIGCLFLPWFVPASDYLHGYGYLNELAPFMHPLWGIAIPLIFLTSLSILLSIIKKEVFQFLVIFFLVLNLLYFIYSSQYILSQDPIPYFSPRQDMYVAEETSLGAGFYTSVIGILIALMGPIITILDIRGKTTIFPKTK